jgi:formylglycine-generating enzyme required for sulfatase activity
VPVNVCHVTTGAVLRLIPPGSFEMGARPDDLDAERCELPRRTVHLSGFYIGVTPVTWGQWRRIIAPTSPPSPPADSAVDGISWLDAATFVRRVGDGLRLPTEAEWERAARGHTDSRYWWGDDYRSDLATDAPEADRPLIVGQRPANQLGLFDMLGGVWEWCADSWHDSYEGAPSDGAAWCDAEPDAYVLRGGMWSDFFELAAFLRSSCRYAAPGAERRSGHGLRLAVSVADVAARLERSEP